MAITKRATKVADAVIEAAPDAKPARWQRGTKTQITVSLSPRLLERLDEAASQKDLNRSALLTLAIHNFLAGEESSAP